MSLYCVLTGQYTGDILTQQKGWSDKSSACDSLTAKLLCPVNVSCINVSVIYIHVASS